MLSVPAFSPYWQLFKLGRGGFLASEQAYHWLDDDLILAVLSQIDGERSSQHIAQKLAPEIAVERTYYALMQLAAGGVLIEKSDESQIEANDCEGFRETISAATDDLPYSTSVIVKGETDLLNKEIEGVLAKCTDCAKGQSGKVILYSTRELLSPQLKAAAVEAWNSNHSFLPVKFYGREPIVGPLIAPSKSGCIECLWDRLSSNMRLKLMLPANYEAPFLHDRALAAWEIVSERLRGPYNGRRSPHTLLQWSEREKSWLSHTLIARPHCTLCGNEASWKNDLGLGRFAKRKLTYDTTTLGHRIVPASRTLRHFSLHDSALTGTFFYDNTDSGIPDYFGCYALLNVATPPDIEHGHNLKAFKSMSAGGKGTNRENALASAFGEAIERFCLINDDGRPLHQARPSELHAFSHVAPSKLINFSNRQYDNREQLNELEDHVNIPERMPEDPVLKWWPCWSLTDDKAKLLPAAYVQRSPSLREQDWFSCNSNGMAAGNCCEEALIQGACELIERDAFGLWWYHMRHSPVLDLDTFDSSYLKQVQDGLRADHYELVIYYLAIDTKLPVFAAVALPKDGDGMPMFGIGCHFQPNIALERAVAELGQYWAYTINDSSRRQKLEGVIMQQLGMPLASCPFLRPEIGKESIAWEAISGFALPSLNDEIDFFRDLFDSLGLDWLIADMSRPDLPLKVVRSIVPGLCHIHARFDVERLYSAPIKLGWHAERSDELSLNKMPFFL